MGRAFLGFVASVSLVATGLVMPIAAHGQGFPPVTLSGTDRIFANNDCRGDLESSRHPTNNPSRPPHNGRGNNDDQGRTFSETAIAGNGNANSTFGNNNGACVTIE